MPAKLTLEFVRAAFAADGCVLLAKEYVGSRILMPYICSSGHTSKISWGNFHTGYRCKKCSGHEKLTLEFLRTAFTAEGCTLLATEYVGKDCPMPWICSCGNETPKPVTWGNFRRKHRCMKCSGNEKLTLDFVRAAFAAEGCILLATEYINNETPMPWICSCGNKTPKPIKWGHFRDKHRCDKCGKNKAASKLRLPQLFVELYFEHYNCRVLSEYKNRCEPMIYRCSCGRVDTISLANFSLGKRCNVCADGKRRDTRNNSLDYNIEYLETKIKERMEQLEN